jgi:hypothetical protein
MKLGFAQNADKKRMVTECFYIIIEYTDKLITTLTE